MAHAKNHDYHILPPSIWPLFGSLSALVMASGVYASNKATADQIVLTARQLDAMDEAASSPARSASERSRAAKIRPASLSSDGANESTSVSVLDTGCH